MEMARPPKRPRDGLSQGTVMVLKDPEAQHQKEEGAVRNTATLESVSEGEGDV
jgi:hypothetical protein